MKRIVILLATVFLFSCEFFEKPDDVLSQFAGINLLGGDNFDTWVLGIGTQEPDTTVVVAADPLQETDFASLRSVTDPTPPTGEAVFSLEYKNLYPDGRFNDLSGGTIDHVGLFTGNIGGAASVTTSPTGGVGGGGALEFSFEELEYVGMSLSFLPIDNSQYQLRFDLKTSESETLFQVVNTDPSNSELYTIVSNTWTTVPTETTHDLKAYSSSNVLYFGSPPSFTTVSLPNQTVNLDNFVVTPLESTPALILPLYKTNSAWPGEKGQLADAQYRFTFWVKLDNTTDWVSKGVSYGFQYSAPGNNSSGFTPSSEFGQWKQLSLDLQYQSDDSITDDSILGYFFIIPTSIQDPDSTLPVEQQILNYRMPGSILITSPELKIIES